MTYVYDERVRAADLVKEAEIGFTLGGYVTQKDYKGLAAALKRVKPGQDDSVLNGNFLVLASEDEEVWTACVKAVATALEDDNPRFKREMFYEACGM